MLLPCIDDFSFPAQMILIVSFLKLHEELVLTKAAGTRLELWFALSPVKPSKPRSGPVRFVRTTTLPRWFELVASTVQLTAFHRPGNQASRGLCSN